MASSLRIGAAWWKKDRNGDDYLSLSISSPVALVLQPDQRLSLFSNQSKQSPNQPDFDLVILAGRPQDSDTDDFSPDQAPRQGYGQGGQGRSQAPEDVRPAPRQPAAHGAQRTAPAPRGTRQPAPPPDYDEELEDPFAEDAPLLAPAPPRGRR